MKSTLFFKGSIIHFLFISIDADCDSFELKNYLKRERESARKENKVRNQYFLNYLWKESLWFLLSLLLEPVGSFHPMKPSR